MQFTRNTSSGKKAILLIIKLGLAVVLFFGAGKSILFKRKITPKIMTKTKANLIATPKTLTLELVFFVNCI